MDDAEKTELLKQIADLTIMYERVVYDRFDWRLRFERLNAQHDKLLKIVNEIAILGASELAYTSEFTERVNMLVRKVSSPTEDK